MFTKARISISRKNKQTEQYETDFSGYVGFLGTVAAKKASTLQERDRIKLGDVDVRTKYDKEKNTTYYNFNIYSFESADGSYGGGARTSQSSPQPSSPQPQVDGGDFESWLPF